eukprot:12425703-Karenia_brevis.AAC.1
MTKQRTLSDHAMLRWHFVKKSDKAKQFRPIPLAVFKHKRFKVNLKKLETAACLDSLGPAERLAKHKELMLEAANFTKREMLLCESSVFTRSQTLLTISRAYWDQNLKVASLLWARSALARHHLGARRM